MSGGSEKVVEKAIKDPAKIYSAPEAVLADDRLTDKEKDKILHSWEQDQIALLRAEEENMVQKDGAPPPGDLLVKVKEAEKILEGDAKEIKK
jgi:hypothetical protein